MKTNLLLIVLLGTAACRVNRPIVAPPAALAGRATAYPVTNFTGFSNRNRYVIGDFRVTKMHTGWKSTEYRSRSVRPGTFKGITDILTNSVQKSRSKQTFQLNIEGFGKLPVVLSATENLSQENARLLSAAKFLGHSTPVAVNHLFAGTVTFLTDTTDREWNFMLFTNWKQGEPTTDEFQEGFMTNLRDAIIIRPEWSNTLVDTTARWVQVLQTQPAFLPKLVTGYSFYNETDDPIAYISTIPAKPPTLWLRNDLDDRRRTLLSAVSAALVNRIP